MDKKLAQKKTQRFPQDHTAKYDSGPGSSMDGRTASTKRKADPDWNPPRKRRRVQKDLRIQVLRKTVWEFEERLTEKSKKRKRDWTDDDSASSSRDTDTGSSSSTGTGKRTCKRKTTAEDDKGPSSKGTGKGTGKRKAAAEDDKGRSSKGTGKRKAAAEDDKGPSSKGTGKRTGIKKTAAEAGERPSSKETGKGTGKRKAAAEDGEGPSKKRRRTTTDQDNKAKTGREAAEEARVEFQAKYKQQQQLGQGGCGSVFAGYRRADNLPVAIKHIERDQVYYRRVDNRGRKVSMEVAIMLKIANGTTGAVGTSAPVSLLDCYDLDQELVLVLERPVPCEDLLEYINNNGGSLEEDEARIIMKQLVDAARDLQDHHIFHRDIKAENILIETGSDIPRVRIIDFGLGCFFKKRSSYRIFLGTSAHVPPEWVTRSTYRPGPTTVWQLGVVLFDSLTPEKRFTTTQFLKRQLEMKRKLSEDCLDFLQWCLTQDPGERATLEDLQQHPWLR